MMGGYWIHRHKMSVFWIMQTEILKNPHLWFEWQSMLMICSILINFLANPRWSQNAEQITVLFSFTLLFRLSNDTTYNWIDFIRRCFPEQTASPNTHRPIACQETKSDGKTFSFGRSGKPSLRLFAVTEIAVSFDVVEQSHQLHGAARGTEATASESRVNIWVSAIF